MIFIGPFFIFAAVIFLISATVTTIWFAAWLIYEVFIKLPIYICKEIAWGVRRAHRWLLTRG